MEFNYFNSSHDALPSSSIYVDTGQQVQREAVESHLHALYTRALQHLIDRQAIEAERCFLSVLSHSVFRALGSSHSANGSTKRCVDEEEKKYRKEVERVCEGMSPLPWTRLMLRLHFFTLKNLAVLLADQKCFDVALLAAMSALTVHMEMSEEEPSIRVEASQYALQCSRSGLARLLAEESVEKIQTQCYSIEFQRACDVLLDVLYVSDRTSLHVMASRVLTLRPTCLKAQIFAAEDAIPNWYEPEFGVKRRRIAARSEHDQKRVQLIAQHMQQVDQDIQCTRRMKLQSFCTGILETSTLNVSLTHLSFSALFHALEEAHAFIAAKQQKHSFSHASHLDELLATLVERSHSYLNASIISSASSNWTSAPHYTLTSPLALHWLHLLEENETRKLVDQDELYNRDETENGYAATSSVISMLSMSRENEEASAALRNRTDAILNVLRAAFPQIAELTEDIIIERVRKTTECTSKPMHLNAILMFERKERLMVESCLRDCQSAASDGWLSFSQAIVAFLAEKRIKIPDEIVLQDLFPITHLLHSLCKQESDSKWQQRIEVWLYHAQVALIRATYMHCTKAIELLASIVCRISSLLNFGEFALNDENFILLSWLIAHNHLLHDRTSAALIGFDFCDKLLLNFNSSGTVTVLSYSICTISKESVQQIKTSLFLTQLAQDVSSLHRQQLYSSCYGRWKNAQMDFLSDNHDQNIDSLASALSEPSKKELLNAIIDSAQHLQEHGSVINLVMIRLQQCARECAAVLKESVPSSSEIIALRHNIKTLFATVVESLRMPGSLLCIDQTRANYDVAAVLLFVARNSIPDGILPLLLQTVELLTASRGNTCQWLSFVIASHRALICANECATVEGRNLLLLYWDGLFDPSNRLLFSEHIKSDVLASRLSLLPKSFAHRAEREDDTMTTYPVVVSSSDTYLPFNNWTGPEISSSQAHELVLDEACQLLSDLYYIFVHSHPSPSSQSHMDISQLVSSETGRLRLHTLILALFDCYTRDGQLIMHRPLRDSLLHTCEILLETFSGQTQLILSGTSFVSAVLNAPVRIMDASMWQACMAIVPSVIDLSRVVNVPIASTVDSIVPSFFFLYAAFILPPFIERVLGDEDWFSQATYRRQWDEEHELISRVLPLALLSAPHSPHLWFAIGLSHWEPAMKEMESNYAELWLDPLNRTPSHGMQPPLEEEWQLRMKEQRSLVSVWSDNFVKAYRAFGFSLLQLQAAHGCCSSIFDALGGGEKAAEMIDEPFQVLDTLATSDRFLAHLQWMLLGLMAYRVAQLELYLPAIDLPILNSDVAPLQMAQRCFTLALRLDQSNELCHFFLGKCLFMHLNRSFAYAAANRSPLSLVASCLSHLSEAAKVGLSRTQLGHWLPPALHEHNNIAERIMKASDKAAKVVKPEALLIYRLHKARLDLLRQVAPLMHCKVKSSRFESTFSLPNLSHSWTTALLSPHDCEELLVLIEHYHFCSPSSSSESCMSLQRRCDIVAEDICNALLLCCKCEYRFHPALITVAGIDCFPQLNILERMRALAEYTVKSNEKILENFDESHGLLWWHRTPWRGCRGYFKSFKSYLSLCHRTQDAQGFINLWQSMLCTRKFKSLSPLADLLRVILYARSLSHTLQAAIHQKWPTHWTAFQVDLLTQRACQAAHFLVDEGVVDSRSLVLLSYAVTRHVMNEAPCVDDLELEQGARDWLSSARWARRFQISNLFSPASTMPCPLLDRPGFNVESSCCNVTQYSAAPSGRGV